MKVIHWLLVAIIAIAMLGFPVFYTLSAPAAATVPGPEVKNLKDARNRTVAGGGPRLGK